MKLIRNITILAALLKGAVSFAFPGMGDAILWETKAENIENGLVRVVFTGTIPAGHYTYTTDDPYSATTITDMSLTGGVLEGGLYELNEPRVEADGSRHFHDRIVIAQNIRPEGPEARLAGTIFANVCTETTCSAQYFDFEQKIATNPEAEVSPAETEEREGKSLWGLIIEAVLWGLAMLLTPCVFPMVPMTVSFFMKGSESLAAGRFKALMYGFFIILLYTLPISVIIVLTRVIGGDAVTADIFNWLSTHWIPNIIFFVIFMAFAASFFGAFEISMPQSLINKSDQGSDKKGLAGVFFMALTLVLVSFSCTGPIVGTVLIESTQGKFWAPVVTMLAFSTAFALPFTVIALFPSLLTKMKKSGGSWLNSVKVVLGFIEIALGLKFLSVADQTYHWGILDREVYLAIWITVFSLLGFYLLGKIRFKSDEPVEKLSVTRLTLAIAVFSFVVYLIPGMWGAPLSKLSGYLPPMSTQDFVLTKGVQQTAAIRDDSATEESFGKKYDLHLPLGLDGYFTIEEGLEAAKEAGKPVFVDITGHGCVNCREMESRVWSDPRVLEILRNRYIIVALYTDDKTLLEEEDIVTDAKTGKAYKDLGRANSYIARSRWNVNSQPNYILLTSEGEMIAPPRGYNLDIEEFIEFLNLGLKQ